MTPGVLALFGLLLALIGYGPLLFGGMTNNVPVEIPLSAAVLGVWLLAAAGLSALRRRGHASDRF